MDLDNNQKPFIWRKKYEEKGIKIDEKQIELEQRKRAEANRIELEKIKERQRLRQLELQQKLSDNEFMQRQKELEHHLHWEQQEDDFILKQHRQRSKIRIRDGRPKTIDLFAHYIDVFGAKPSDNQKKSVYIQQEEIDLSDSPVELLNPCDWFNGLRLSDLEKLEPDIDTYKTADYKENQEYWDDILHITKDEMMKLRAAKDQSLSEINPTVRNEIMSLLNDKSISELNQLEDEMLDILDNHDPAIDPTFYKNALPILRAYRAKIRLSANHKQNLKRQKQKILDEPKSVTKVDDDADRGEKPHVEETNEPEPNESDNEDEKTNDDSEKQNEGLDELNSRCIRLYEEGRYSPEMITRDQIEPGAILRNYQEEFDVLCHQRNQVCNASNLQEAKMATMTPEERDFIKTASKGMDNNEESTFGCEAPIRGHSYVWTDKYQPRKPRYFNRVHTGFEWNKYNQTHYDIDNPPPKVVQGYKFNIFYPDLIDKSRAPTFSITPCKDDKDFCIIRFTAGPPYEDIAFRIVNREWNNSHKSGYKCQFINNVLQLWFQFKRYRYRR